MFVADGKGNRGLGRRAFLVGSGAALAGLALWRVGTDGLAVVQAAAKSSKPPKPVTIVEFSDSGERIDEIKVPMIHKTDAEWRAQLSPAAFHVTREAGTEIPFSGALLNVHDKGVFRCICCDTALFNARTKFESGTGWPSFWAAIALENVVEQQDLSFDMQRTAISCALCGAHTGHLFHDGPEPTHLRYCMNSVAMRFAKAS